MPTARSTAMFRSYSFLPVSKSSSETEKYHNIKRKIFIQTVRLMLLRAGRMQSERRSAVWDMARLVLFEVFLLNATEYENVKTVYINLTNNTCRL